MKKMTSRDPETHSPDFVAENLAVLRELFPELITEGADGAVVNLDVLKQLVGDKTVTDAEEKYGLNWHGKRLARQIALAPSTGTLRPCPEESVDWETTRNLMIEGDNLEVLKLLQKSYSGKVKMIYIDPPYNTGKDFVYPDDFQDGIKNYLSLTGQNGPDGRKITSNTEASGRFHTDWLNMMYPRLKLAHTLLQEDGAILISIDDSEANSLGFLLDEIFGSENFIARFVWEKRTTRENRRVFSFNHEYLICFAKNKPHFEQIRNLLPTTDQVLERYANPDNDPRGPWQSVSLNAQAGHATKDQFYSLTTPSGRSVEPPPGRCWSVIQKKYEELVKDNRIWFGETGDNVPRRKLFLSEAKDGLTPHTLWSADEAGTTDSAKKELIDLFSGINVFETPKPVTLLQRIIQITTEKSDFVLDFFAGSGTTAHATMLQNLSDEGNRRFILVQLPEPLDPENRDQKTAADFCDMLGKPRTLAEVAKERLRRAGAKLKEENPLFFGDVGFKVFKLDTSNIRAWEPDRDDLAGSLGASIDHIKFDRGDMDILFELLLKLGFDLCVPVQTKSVAGAEGRTHEIVSVGGGALIVCLSRLIGQDDAEPLALSVVEWRKELQPSGETTALFLDSAFENDVAKCNVTAILEQFGIENVRSL